MTTPVGDGPQSDRLTHREAIPLAYALVARVAADHDIRLLAIKGAVLAHHELRAPRVSADIDVLLHPDELQGFLTAMVAVGWREQVETTAPRLRRQHAVNLINDHWPFGVDTHDHFPGFLAPPGEVFDELWRRRVELSQAGQPVWATDLSGSAAIAALHHLRERDKPANRTAFDTLVTKTSARMDGADLADLSTLATATGAVHTLTPFLEAVGAPAAPPHPDEAAQAAHWDRSTSADRAAVWRHGWEQTPWWRRPAFAWRAFQPDEGRLRQLYFRDFETPLWRLRVRRARHVLGELRRRRSAGRGK